MQILHDGEVSSKVIKILSIWTIFWQISLSVPNFKVVYSVVVGISQSGPKQWIDWLDNQLKGHWHWPSSLRVGGLPTHYSFQHPYPCIMPFKFTTHNSFSIPYISILCTQHHQQSASHLTMGRLRLCPVCPGSSWGLSAISCWLFHRGRLSAHLLLSSAPLPVIIEADTVPLWLPSYSASSPFPPPIPVSSSVYLITVQKKILPGPG